LAGGRKTSPCTCVCVWCVCVVCVRVCVCVSVCVCVVCTCVCVFWYAVRSPYIRHTYVHHGTHCSVPINTLHIVWIFLEENTRTHASTHTHTITHTHQLPAGLLLCVLPRLKLVVLCDVPVQRAHDDHGHHASQEQHDHDAVDDGEPMDLVVNHQQVGVPAGGPADVASLRVLLCVCVCVRARVCARVSVHLRAEMERCTVGGSWRTHAVMHLL